MTLLVLLGLLSIAPLSESFLVTSTFKPTPRSPTTPSRYLGWLRGVDITEFIDPTTEGTFQGKSYKGSEMTGVELPNHVPAEFESFVDEQVAKYERTGVVVPWETVADTSKFPKPQMVMPLGVEESKPRAFLDARWLNLMGKKFPFKMDAAATMVAEQPDKGKTDLLVANKDEGYDLHGVLTVKREESKSLWVLCHGLCSSCEGTVPRFVSENLDANTFRFDFAGCGKSGGDWKYAGYDRELGDLRAVVTHLRELGWSVDCVLGHSKGAAAVLRYGETFDDVPLVVNVAGRFDTSETPRSRFTEEQWDKLESSGSFKWNVRGTDLTINKSDFEERAALDMKRTAGAIKCSKVLTIHGTEDETIPVADAHEFDKVLLNNELVVVEGATHRFATEPEQEAVTNALNRYLG